MDVPTPQPYEIGPKARDFLRKTGPSGYGCRAEITHLLVTTAIPSQLPRLRSRRRDRRADRPGAVGEREDPRRLRYREEPAAVGRVVEHEVRHPVDVGVGHADLPAGRPVHHAAEVA